MEKVTEANPLDTSMMVESFCASFSDDPGLSWIWPDRADRLSRLASFFTPIVGGTINHGTAFRSETYDAVSLWRHPENITPTQDEITPWYNELAQAFSQGAERYQLMRDTLKQYQPTEFRWCYLQFIGVRPHAQGKGLGGAIIKAGLERATKKDLPVYVEVMNPDNLGYYQHIGFETVSEFDIPDCGPHVWAMLWRAP